MSVRHSGRLLPPHIVDARLRSLITDPELIRRMEAGECCIVGGVAAALSWETSAERAIAELLPAFGEYVVEAMPGPNYPTNHGSSEALALPPGATKYWRKCLALPHGTKAQQEATLSTILADGTPAGYRYNAEDFSVLEKTPKAAAIAPSSVTRKLQTHALECTKVAILYNTETRRFYAVSAGAGPVLGTRACADCVWDGRKSRRAATPDEYALRRAVYGEIYGATGGEIEHAASEMLAQYEALADAARIEPFGNFLDKRCIYWLLTGVGPDSSRHEPPPLAVRSELDRACLIPPLQAFNEICAREAARPRRDYWFVDELVRRVRADELATLQTYRSMQTWPFHALFAAYCAIHYPYWVKLLTVSTPKKKV